MATNDDLEPLTAGRLREIAVDACRVAADMVRRSEQHQPMATKSTGTDIVTATDLEAERLIRAVLTRHAPGSRVLAEEGGHTTAGSGPHGDIEWVVDPLDGTVNFAYRIPIVAVSVAAVVGGRVVAGAVIDVHRDEMFSAHVGGGATLDDRAIVVNRCNDPAMALVATGFSYRSDLRRRHGRTIAELVGVVRDVRGFGSAALHFCWVACGRIDVYVERDIKPWDYAAGSLIAAEAGADVELPCIENDGLVLATNPALRSSLRPMLTW